MLRVERQSARMSKITNDGLDQPGTLRMLYTHMITVGVKGLIQHVDAPTRTDNVLELEISSESNNMIEDLKVIEHFAVTKHG